jgi:hypothetical protein
MPECKSLPQFTKAIDGRTVDGIFCVHGNIDDGRDRSHPGLFGDFTVGGRRRAVFLWQHNAMAPPIAKIERVYEVAKADLPPAVKLYAPDASGGVGVARTYLETPRGDEVLAGLASGAITEMSYAYEPTKWDFEEVEGGGVIRNLYRCDLLDISDVNWGMNPATSADGTKTARPLIVEHATVLAAVGAYIERYQQLAALRAKEGRVLSGENRKRIEEALDALDGARTALKELLAATEKPETGKTARRRTQDVYQEWQAIQARLRALGVPPL